MQNIPSEIIFAIFDQLNFNDMCSLSLVNKAFYRITSSEIIWQKNLGKHYLENIQDFTSKQSYMFNALLKNAYLEIANIFNNNFSEEADYHLQLTFIKIHLKLDLIEDALYLIEEFIEPDQIKYYEINDKAEAKVELIKAYLKLDNIEEAINYLKFFKKDQDTYINKARSVIAEKLFTLKRDQEAIALLYNIKAPFQHELLSIIKISKDKQQIEKAKSYYLSKIENAHPINKMDNLLRLIEICKEIGDSEFVENSFNEIKKLQDQVSYPQNLADLQVRIMKIYPNLEEIQKAKSLITETKNISDKIQAKLNFIKLFPEREEIDSLKVIVENLNPNPNFLSLEFITKKLAQIGIIKTYLRLGEIQKAKDYLTKCNNEILIEANLEIIKNCKDNDTIEKAKKYINDLSKNGTDVTEIQLELTKLYPSFEEINKAENFINNTESSEYKVKSLLELISILISHRNRLFKKI